MTATDELRHLLDERGIEHFDNDDKTLWGSIESDYYPYGATENFGGSLNVHTHAYDLTPAQAIAATLGAGTCQLKPWEMERDTGFYDCMECACGYVADVADWAEWHYCPSCGAKVVDE